MENLKLDHNAQSIAYSSYNENITDNLLKKGDNLCTRKDSLVSSCLEVPIQQRAYGRHSIASRQSIELFLSTFPSNETEFANREIMNAVHEIMHSSIGIDSKMSCVEKTRLIIRSHKFHLFLIGLVVIDCICVVLQVVLDIVSKENHDPVLYIIEEIVEILSVFILSLFLVSIVFHMVLVPRIFFRSKLELFDSLIVLISFCLEIISIIKKDSVREIEAAVITFRFWRIIRIVNAIVITVEKRVFTKLENLKKDIKSVLDENKLMEIEISRKTVLIQQLKTQLNEKTKESNQLYVKFENFMNENQKLRVEQNNHSGDMKHDLTNLEQKCVEYEHKLKTIERENVQLKNYLKKNMDISTDY